MDGRSINSLTTLCSTTAQRANSSANELHALLDLPTLTQDRLDALSALANSLDELNLQASQLEASFVASTVSMEAHDTLKQLLTGCDATMAVLYKQVLRIQPDNTDGVNAGFLVAYDQTVRAYNELLKSLLDIATAVDRHEQEANLSFLRSSGIIEQAERASQISSAQRGILVDQGDSPYVSGSSSTPNPSKAKQASEDAGPPPYSKEAEPSSSSSSSTQPAKMSWGKSLKNSFKSLALSVVPQSGPFVSALCQAATIGDTQQIVGLLNQGANINGRNEKGKNALQCAILADQEDAARLLLASGASTSGSGWSGGPPLFLSVLPPLFLAASAGSLKTAKLFIDKGASTSEKGKSGQSCFVDVVYSGNLDGIQFLLKHGCSAETKNISGEAVITHAVQKKNLKLAELLLEFGASVNSTDAAGSTLVAVALGKKDYDMAELLLKKDANPNVKTLYGSPLLADEISNRRFKTAKLLLDWGADANATDFQSQPILILAIKASKVSPEDKVDLVRHLLAKGAKANVVDSIIKTPAIRYAAEAGLPELISLMLQHGAKTTDTMPNGDSLLKYAIDQGRRDLIETLLLNGADPNSSAGENGVKPLVQALVKQDFEMIRLLKEAGADTHAPEVEDAAKALGKPDIFEALWYTGEKLRP